MSGVVLKGDHTRYSQHLNASHSLSCGSGKMLGASYHWAGHRVSFHVRLVSGNNFVYLICNRCKVTYPNLRYSMVTFSSKTLIWLQWWVPSRRVFLTRPCRSKTTSVFSGLVVLRVSLFQKRFSACLPRPETPTVPQSQKRSLWSVSPGQVSSDTGPPFPFTPLSDHKCFWLLVGP